MRDAEVRQLARERARAPVEMVLVEPAAVDVDELHPAQRCATLLAIDHADGIPRVPALEDGVIERAAIDVEREADAERLARIGAEDGAHREHHDRPEPAALLLLHRRVERSDERLDAAE